MKKTASFAFPDGFEFPEYCGDGNCWECTLCVFEPMYEDEPRRYCLLTGADAQYCTEKIKCPMKDMDYFEVPYRTRY